MFSIDPGSEQSAIVSFNGKVISFAKIMPNTELLAMLRASKDALAGATVAIESIASYGMPVGKETFDTCEWCGRFREAAEVNGATVMKVYRKEIKVALCGTTKAKDANISQFLRDTYGKEVTKGIVKDLWSALAVAHYALNKK